MLKKLTISNVKCFQSQDFNLSNLTIFCGANSVGKSTAIQCILLLRQNHNKQPLSENNKVELMGEYFSFGHISDFQNHAATSKLISIALDSTHYSFDTDKANIHDYELDLIISGVKNKEHSILSNDFFYLSAERLGPKNDYNVRCNTSKIDVGIFGEYAISEFTRLSTKPAQNQNLAKSIIRLRDSNSEHHEEGIFPPRDITLDVAVISAMRLIHPTFNINVEEVRSIDRIVSSYPHASSSKPIRPVNTGFGISYFFPIVVAALCCRSGGTLIIENPEVHLHPKAQSALSEFLTLVSTTGVQVIIETHSDHIINGARVFIKEKKIPPETVIINSISEVNHRPVCTQINIDSEGCLDKSPDGFFDQIQHDLMRLF